MKQAVRAADGSFDVQGRRFRLQELDASRFAVEDDHGHQIGVVQLLEPKGDRKAPKVVIEDAGPEPDVVKRIAKALEMPRGLLPVQ